MSAYLYFFLGEHMEVVARIIRLGPHRLHECLRVVAFGSQQVEQVHLVVLIANAHPDPRKTQAEYVHEQWNDHMNFPASLVVVIEHWQLVKRIWR